MSKREFFMEKFIRIQNNGISFIVAENEIRNPDRKLVVIQLAMDLET